MNYKERMFYYESRIMDVYLCTSFEIGIKQFCFSKKICTFAGHFERLGDIYYPSVPQVVLNIFNQSETTGHRDRTDTMKIK